MDLRSPPVIGIPCCVRPVNDHPYHVVGDKYVRAVASAAGGLPLLVPALGAGIDPADLVGRLDGLLLTGSRSNVEPHHYDGAPSRPETAHDAERDATTLPLIRAAVAGGLPLLAVCRGIQELNVALGGNPAPATSTRCRDATTTARSRAPPRRNTRMTTIRCA